MKTFFNKTIQAVSSGMKIFTTAHAAITDTIMFSCDAIQSVALMVSLPVKVSVAVLKTLNLESKIEYDSIKVVSDEIKFSTKKIETLIIDQFNEKNNYLKTLLNNSKSDTEGNILTKLRENLNKENVDTKEIKFDTLDTDANEALHTINNSNKAIEKIQETAKMITDLAEDIKYIADVATYYTHSAYVYMTKKPIEQTTECSESHIVKTNDGDEFCAFGAVESAQNVGENNQFGAACAANDNMEVIGGELITSAA